MKAILSSRRHCYLARISIFLIMVALITGMVGCGGGNGSDPYADYIKIYNWTDLDNIRNNLVAKYVLMNDLNATSAGYTELASPTANSGKGWEPIGNYTGGNFTGTFDGQGYEIKDLFIDRPDEDYVGLFGYVAESGVIEDIGVVNVAVTGDNWTGGLVGGISGTVSNSYSTGSVTGSELVGGLVGGSNGTVSNSYSTGNVTGNGTSIYLFVGGLVGGSNGTVSNSYSTGSVTGTGTSYYLFVGGLVGGSGSSGAVSNSYSTGNVTGTGGGQSSAFGGLAGVNFGTVSNSYSTGSMTGTRASNYTHVGGLVGYNSNGTVSNSYAIGNVTGSGHSFVGGLVGFNVDDGTVSNSYATGNVSGTWDVGGLVGYNFESTVSDSYSTGSVSGNASVGGLVGVNTGTVTNSFWDIQTSGQNISAGGTGKNTTEMRDIITFSGATWNITTVGGLGERNTSYIWNIVNGVTYPFLSWQPV